MFRSRGGCEEAYVDETPFKIITDYASLKQLMIQKDLSGRLARWSLKLQTFDFVIEYRKGSANIVPVVLLRMHTEGAIYTLRPPMGDQQVVERTIQHLNVDLLSPNPRSKLGNITLL